VERGVTMPVVFALYLLAVTVCGVLLFRHLRRYAERLEHADGDRADRVHRMQRAVLASGFGAALVAMFVGGLLLALVLRDHAARRSVVMTQLPVIIMVFAAMAMFWAAVRAVRPSFGRLRGIDPRPQNRARGLLALVIFLVVVGVGFAALQAVTSLGPRWLLWPLGYLALLIAIQAVWTPLLLFSIKARPLDEGTRTQLLGLADRLGVRVRDFRVFPARRRKVASALQVGALPGLRYVLLSDYLLDNMDEREVEGVVAHELAHARGHHLLVKLAVVLGSLLGLDAVIAAAAFALHGSGALLVGAALTPVLFPVLIVTVNGLVGVRLEQRADDVAAREVGPAGLADALDKLAQLNDMKRRTGRTWSLLTQHPGIEQRVRRLRSEEPAETAARRQTASSPA
jgi:Zn-dependent protease with chaperone function